MNEMICNHVRHDPFTRISFFGHWTGVEADNDTNGMAEK
jgi:hypothetical protein